MTSSYSVSSSLYVNISDLEPGRTNSGLKVRVIRCYGQPSSYKSDPDGKLEMIVHDEIEDRIHATIDYGVFKEKKMDIIEGGLYKIKTFMVAHDMTKYKSTTICFKLRLTNQTSICPFQDPDFPSSMHRFRDLFEISNDINVDNFQLLDVIGRVVSYQKPTFVPKLSTRRMDFRIANTENMELGCSLWSEYFDPVLVIFEKEDPRPIIICIQFGKTTRIFDKSEMTPDVSASQNTMIAEDFNDVYALFKNSSADVKKISTLTELQEKNKYWNFRYKIEVLVADSSGCATMLMWDGQCTTLIGKSAKYIKQLNEILDSLVDRRVLFKVKCPANNVNKDLSQFTVSRVAVDEEIFEMYAANYTPSKGSTTACKNEVNEVDNKACSKLSKGNQKVGCEDELENETEIEDGTNQRDGKDIVDSEQNLEDEKEDCADDMSLKDLKEKKSSGYDAKYTSKNKKMKVKHDK
ncbi:hypothetical protein CASFOL_022844 [Castilleja foliolosa]|uniref:Replication protein A 70 kDa DNA-binding subunit B/D first OB fold domain-containing protein n=1 Tax=Castilleja foliolosa TaxID=1961234 RepID=A0ABD3CXK6_9LAMI